MVTENVTVSFIENGARIVKRKIDEIGQAANNATRGIFLLQRALFVLGGAGIVSSLTKMADALTNMENKLRLTSTSTANLEAVQDALFESANRSRSSVEATADVYSRIALSARNLGASQQQVIAVTETLQKAAIVSGASAQEANAALIQLGQGLASNRLSGDELRSVLEQLPYVADIIADYMTKTGQYGTVTRGTLRQLGKEGKLTSQVVFDAIAAAQNGVDQLFAQTNPTIEQGFRVARNNLLKFIDDFDDAVGASTALAKAIIVISENLDIVVGVLGLVAAGFALSFGASLLGRINSYVHGFTRAGAALARYASIQVASASKQVAATSATLNDTRARLQNITTRQAQIGATLRNAKAEYAEAEAQFAGGRARSAATGQFIAMQGARDRLTAATIRLTAAERANNIATGRSAALSTEVTVAETAQAAARTRLGVATAAQGGFMARLAGTFPLLTGLVRGAAGAFSWLFAILAANPIGAVIAVIAALIALIFAFGDRIKITADGVVSLRDAMIAAFQLIYEAISSVVGVIIEFLQPAIDIVKQAFLALGQAILDAFTAVGSFVLTVINTILGTIVGFINGTIRAWGTLPAAILDIMNIIRNGVLTAVENLVNGFIEGVQSIPEKFGQVMDSIVQFASDAVTYIFDAFSALPGAISAIAEKAAAFLKQKFLEAINVIINALNALPGIAIDTFDAVGTAAGDIQFDLPSLPSFEPIFDQGRLSLDQFKGDVTGAASDVGKIYADEFASAYSRNLAGEAGQAVLDAAGKLGQTVIDRARQNIANVPPSGTISTVPGTPVTPNTPAGTGGGANEKTFAQELAELQQKIELEKQYGIQKEINNQILSIEKSIKRELSATEKDQVASAVQLLEISKAYGSILEEIRGPQEALQFGQAALNQLFEEGAISLENYNSKLRDLQINADKAANTIGGGFRAAIGGAIQSAGEFGESLGGVIVGAAGRAADAIVEFAQTGKLNIRAFFADLFAQLLKLAAQRLLLSFLGGFLGIPGASLGGSGGLSFATGGSILPSGPGSTDSQVVAFAKRPDERVDILTPGQQQAKKNGEGQGGGTTVVQSPPVNIAAVLSPSDIIGVFNDGGDTQIINILQRNSSTVKQIAQS